MTDQHPLGGRRATLATLHDKAALIAPAFEAHLGVAVDTVELDTDALGTFSGEVPRPGPPLETAVAKARLSMTATGSDLALASEGMIGPHPDAPMISCDREILVLVDDLHGFTVHDCEIEIAVPTLCIDVVPDGIEDARLHAAGFPEHGLIVRPTGNYDLVVKGIHDMSSLRRAVTRCAGASPAHTARIESDLRANHHPARRRVIARAAERLALRLSVLCGGCGTPGWGVVRREPGAPCARCAAPTALALNEVRACAKCDLTESIRVAPDGGVDPARCPECNP